MKPYRKKHKKSDTIPKFILEEIIGLTIKNSNGLASNTSISICVYLAGCVVVVYNVDSGTQSHLTVSHRMPKPLSCVAVSRNGKFVAAGESGHQPAVLIWDLDCLASVFELKGHQIGVACMDFSPDGKYVVSVGSSHDGLLCLWDWRCGKLIAKVKACSSFSSVASVIFSSDAKFIVTSGSKHLKLWRLSTSSRASASARTGSLAIHGKPINLGHHKGCSFVAIASPILIGGPSGEFAPVYALTDTGILCLLHSGSEIANSVDLKVKKCFALSASNKLVACACDTGMVKLFASSPLKYAGSLQYGDGKSCNKSIHSYCNKEVNESECQPLALSPDAIACQFMASEKLVVVYGDHSLYIWDIHDGSNGSKSCVLVSHSGCIWDIRNLSCEYLHDPSLACVARGCPGGVSFTTCSADGKIRLWDLVLQADCSSTANDWSFESVGNFCLVSAGIFERDSVMSGFRTRGFRAMAVSSDGKHLAAGDCEGNLHLYNLHTFDYIYIQDAHDAEIMSLTFSLPIKKDDSSEKDLEGEYLLVSGGKDCKIHLYDVQRNFDLIASVSDHSAAVTSVKVNGNACKLLSCCADRSLVLYDVAATSNGYKLSRCHNQVVSHGNVYGMALDPMMDLLVTVGKEKINTFNIAAGKLICSFKQDGGLGDPIHVTMDPSSSYLVCSFSNKSICMYDFLTGDLVARAAGHGEAITGVIFLPDCKHLVSVDVDGCIFVWKVPAPLSLKMLQRVKEIYCPLSPIIRDSPLDLSQIKFLEGDDSFLKVNPVDEAVVRNSKSNQVSQQMPYQVGNCQEATPFNFSISRLPKWAQANATGADVALTKPDFSSSEQVGIQASSRSTNVLDELRTPSKQNPECSKKVCGGMSKSSPETDIQASSSPQGFSRSFALDKRWLTIHTVCWDLLNSPEVWGLKKMQVPEQSNLSGGTFVGSSGDNQYIKLVAGQGVVGVENSSPEPISVIGENVNRRATIFNDHISANKSGNWCTNQLETKNSCVCHKAGTSKVSEHIQPNSVEGGRRPAIDINRSNIDSEDNDTSYLNSANLPENFKTERRKSSSRRYSSQFVVRCDLLRGQQKQFRTPLRDFGATMRSCENNESIILFEDEPNQVAQESQRTNTSLQDRSSSGNLSSVNGSISHQSNSTGFSTSQNSATMELQSISNQGNCDIEETVRRNTIISCEEALFKLDSSTEKALQLFSKLESLLTREYNSTGPEAQLFDKAAEMLPSIAKKVHTVAMLAQTAQNNTRKKSELDISSFEPFLGTFAENISQRVVEILQKNAAFPKKF